MRAIVFNGLLKSFVDYEINTLEKQIITHFLIKVGIIPVVNNTAKTSRARAYREESDTIELKTLRREATEA